MIVTNPINEYFSKKKKEKRTKGKKERRNFTIVCRSRAVGVLPGNAWRLTKLKIIAFRVRGHVKFHRIIWPTNIYALHSRCNKF